MKLAVLGGGGVRSVFLAKSLVNWAERLNIAEIVFMDNDPVKLQVYGELAKRVAGAANPRVDFSLTTDPVKALKDSDFIITTIRAGKDEARILDERIALKHGVLGQETTGAGGFSMALRSVPVLIEYCRMIKEHSRPGARVFNFTNPSGIITQALRDEGFDNVYGICDAPSEFKKQLAKVLGVQNEEISVECFGLNHLSWFRSVKLNGIEKIGELIDNPMLYTKTDERVFEPDLVKAVGMLLNEYLYFYYYRERAVENISLSGKTRGETILEINKEMLGELSGIDYDNNFEAALAAYLGYHDRRNRSYMSIESEGTNKRTRDVTTGINFSDDDDGGYAGVALNFIEAVISGKEKEMVLSVPNNGSIEGMEADDVVEITCRIGKDGASPVKIGKIPDIQMALIKQVKLYERLTVRAIKGKNIHTAIEALMVHPLVNSYSISKKLVSEYLKAHEEYIGQWR